MVNVEEVSVEEVSVDDDLTVSDKEGVADPSIFKSLESCMSSENEEDLIAFVDKMLSLSQEDAVYLIHESTIFDLLQFHWRWDHAGHKDDPICKWFCSWYQIDSQLFKCFVLQFVPDMLWIFLVKLSQGIQLSGIESVFLCIYNYTVYDEPKRTFVIPDLNRSSLLHVVSSKQESSSGEVTNETFMPKVITTDIETKEVSISEILARSQLIEETLLQYSNNFSNLCNNAQISFMYFLQCYLSLGISSIPNPEAIQQVNEFLVKQETTENPITEIIARFNPKSTHSIHTTCDITTYKEVPFACLESFLDPCIKVLGYSLKKELPESVSTLRAVFLRSQVDLLPRALMLSNSLIHKFNIKF